ncbi:hypothetical protein LTR27_006069 [Elasticomyces elasticus]|nr:hypothetical protein LTR27_006069 [Elasticomyces elasticus]
MENQEIKPRSPTKSTPDSDLFQHHFQEPVMDTNTPAAESTKSALDTSTTALESTEIAAEMQCDHGLDALCGLRGCKSLPADASKPVTPAAIKPVDASTSSKSSTFSSPQMQCEHGPDSTCLLIGCKSFLAHASKPAALTIPYTEARKAKAPSADARKTKKRAVVKRERTDLEHDLDLEPMDYNPQPTPSGLTSRNPNTPKRQKRAADITPEHSSVAAEETGGDQGDNTFLLLEGNEVIKGGKRMLLKLVEFPDPPFGKKKATANKQNYNVQLTPFKLNRERGSHASPSRTVEFMPTRPMALPRGQFSAVRKPAATACQLERKAFWIGTRSDYGSNRLPSW